MINKCLSYRMFSLLVALLLIWNPLAYSQSQTVQNYLAPDTKQILQELPLEEMEDAWTDFRREVATLDTLDTLLLEQHVTHFRGVNSHFDAFMEALKYRGAVESEKGPALEFANLVFPVNTPTPLRRSSPILSEHERVEGLVTRDSTVVVPRYYEASVYGDGVYVLRKVLVVDNNPSDYRYMERALKKHYDEIEIFSAKDGEDAIAKVNSDGPFDLILSDVQMPKMNGIELLSHARTHWPDTPIALMSANVYGARRELPGGTNDPVKIWDKRQTLDRVGRFIDEVMDAHVRDGLKGPNRVLVVDDEEDAREYLKKALEDFYEGVEVVLAVDVQDAIEKQSTSGSFDLILSDMDMPAEGVIFSQEEGIRLFLHVQEHMPQVPFAFVSGSPVHALLQKRGLDPVPAWLKWFSYRLDEFIREIMNPRKALVTLRSPYMAEQVRGQWPAVYQAMQVTFEQDADSVMEIIDKEGPFDFIFVDNSFMLGHVRQRAPDAQVAWILSTESSRPDVLDELQSMGLDFDAVPTSDKPGQGIEQFIEEVISPQHGDGIDVGEMDVPRSLSGDGLAIDSAGDGMEGDIAQRIQKNFHALEEKINGAHGRFEAEAALILALNQEGFEEVAQNRARRLLEIFERTQNPTRLLYSLVAIVSMLRQVGLLEEARELANKGYTRFNAWDSHHRVLVQIERIRVLTALGLRDETQQAAVETFQMIRGITNQPLEVETDLLSQLITALVSTGFEDIAQEIARALPESNWSHLIHALYVGVEARAGLLDEAEKRFNTIQHIPYFWVRGAASFAKSLMSREEQNLEEAQTWARKAQSELYAASVYPGSSDLVFKKAQLAVVEGFTSAHLWDEARHVINDMEPSAQRVRALGELALSLDAAGQRPLAQVEANRMMDEVKRHMKDHIGYVSLYAEALATQAHVDLIGEAVEGIDYISRFQEPYSQAQTAILSVVAKDLGQQIAEQPSEVRTQLAESLSSGDGITGSNYPELRDSVSYALESLDQIAEAYARNDGTQELVEMALSSEHPPGVMLGDGFIPEPADHVVSQSEFEVAQLSSRGDLVQFVFDKGQIQKNETPKVVGVGEESVAWIQSQIQNGQIIPGFQVAVIDPSSKLWDSLQKDPAWLVLDINNMVSDNQIRVKPIQRALMTAFGTAFFDYLIHPTAFRPDPNPSYQGIFFTLEYVQQILLHVEIVIQTVPTLKEAIDAARFSIDWSA